MVSFDDSSHSIRTKSLPLGLIRYVLLPRSMLKRFGKSLEYLIPNNIMVVDFSGKSLSSDGMTALEVIFGSCRRPTIFMVVTSQATFNILLFSIFPISLCIS